MYNNKEMHKATCAECKKECEVPFKPDGTRQFTAECATQKIGHHADIKQTRLLGFKRLFLFCLESSWSDLCSARSQTERLEVSA